MTCDKLHASMDIGYKQH